MGRKFLLSSCALALAFCGASANALVIGTDNSASGSNAPFGSTQAGYYYQQIYSGSAFGGAIDIEQISFYVASGSTLRAGTFQLYLSTTSFSNIAGFDTTSGVDFGWLPAGASLVFDGTLPALADGRLDFDLLSAFNYDPSAGNLVLTVREFSLAGPAPAQADLYFESYNNNGVTNARHYAFAYNFNSGLVTGFNDYVVAVPEASTWAMMIAGFALVGASMRRRRVALSFA